MNTTQTTFDIAELASLAELSSRTIRYYEERGLISPLERGRGHRRRYGPEALERLRFIARLKKLGLTLGEIAALNLAFDQGNTPAMLDELERLLGEHLEQLGERVRELRQLDKQLRSYLKRIRAKRDRLDSSKA